MAESPHEQTEQTQKGIAPGRWLLAGIAAVVAVAFFAALLVVAGRRDSQVALVPAPAVDATTAPAVAPSSSPAPSPSLSSSPTPTPAAAVAATALAIVDGITLGLDDAALAAGVDRAMAALSGRPADDETDLLERLVNVELLAQAAESAGFSIPAAEPEATLVAMLQGWQRQESDLAAALAQQNVDRAQFTAYLRRLVLVERFAAAQAETLSLSVPQFVEQRQREARISFGPAAENLAAQIAAAPTAAPAAPTAPAMSAISDTAALDDLLAATPAPPAASDRGVQPGQLAPAFTLPLVNDPDRPTISWQDLPGQPTVLSFWTTWCPYCRRQTPVLVDAYARWNGQGVRFAGIDVREGAAQVEPYLAEFGIVYPIALDAAGSVADAYDVRGYPTTYFLDAEGRVVARQIGALTETKLDNLIERLIAAE